MTTNKPEVACWVARPSGLNGMMPVNASYEGRDTRYVRLSDFEALKAECEKLRKDAERYNLLASMIVAESTGAVMTPQQEALFGALNTITHLRTADEVHAMFDDAMQEGKP